VETADHARLSLRLSFNWFYDFDRNDSNEAAKLFSVPDFVGDCCKALGAKVRVIVASTPFDLFHKQSAKIIRTAVFGIDENTKQMKNRYVFPANNLVVTNVDIQSVEPVDQKTRDSLQKTVQLAIEITISMIEAAASHEAQRLEQEAKSSLEKQKLHDDAEIEKANRVLLELKAINNMVSTTGQATAEATSRAEASRIEGESNVELSKLRSEAMKITSEIDLAEVQETQSIGLRYQKDVNEMELDRAREMAVIDGNKLSILVNAIGKDTIGAIAEAGPEMQRRQLQALGIHSAVLTDGSIPLNVFQPENTIKITIVKN